MSNLEIYILGPKSSDVGLFLGNVGLGYVQSFKYTCESDFCISYVDLSFCSFKYIPLEGCPNLYHDSFKNDIKNDTVSIVVENFDCAPSQQKVKICLGEKQIGLIGKIEFRTSVHSPYNELTLYPTMRNEIFEKFPSWVTIDYSKAVKEAV